MKVNFIFFYFLESQALLRPQQDLIFNSEVVPADAQEEVENLIKTTSKELKIMIYFLAIQICIDIGFAVDSIVNRNLAYIEMSRFYAEIGIYLFLNFIFYFFDN